MKYDKKETKNNDLKIEKKLSEIQNRLKAPKGQYNSFGKYNYRSAEDILEAVKPLNAEYGISLTLSDDVKEIGGRIYVVATATITDGNDYLSVKSYAREPENKKGMDDSQITGATSSYARKYALNGLYAIDDNKDADTDEHKKQQDNAVKKQPKQQAMKQGKEEIDMQQVHATVEGYVKQLEELGVKREKVVEYICNKHNVGNLFDIQPHILVGEIKNVYLSKKNQLESKGASKKEW